MESAYPSYDNANVIPVPIPKNTEAGHKSRKGEDRGEGGGLLSRQ